MQKRSSILVLFIEFSLYAMQGQTLLNEERFERAKICMERNEQLHFFRDIFDRGKQAIQVKERFLRYQKEERAFSRRLLSFAHRFFTPTLRPLSSYHQYGLLPQGARSIQQQIEDLV